MHSQSYGQRLSTDEFEALAALPANSGRHLELIEGEIVEVVSNSYASEVAMRIGILIGGYILSHDLGRVRGADGGFKIMGDYYIPDFAYVSKVRQPVAARVTWDDVTPDLVVEVISPSDTPRVVRKKLLTYLTAGITVWLVDIEDKVIEVYVPGQPPHTVKVGDTLSGEPVLPGFTLNVAAIFPQP